MKAPAVVFSLGTAIPKHAMLQEDYADLLPSNDSFQQLCRESGIQKRYFCVNEEVLKSILKNKKSLSWRQELSNAHVPELALEASNQAIASWGMPKSAITHLVFATSSGLFSPGADVRLLNLLDLGETVHRVMLCHQHAYGGVVALRMAKDIAENNPEARVLVVCSEMMEFSAQAPDLDNKGMINCVTLGGGAAAAIVGAPEFSSLETARLELHQSIETILDPPAFDIDNLELGSKASIDEDGMHYVFDDRDVTVVCDNLPTILNELVAMAPLVSLSATELFLAMHPGSMELLSRLESGTAKLQLETSRAVLTSYGDMLSASVLFILDDFINASAGPKEWGAVVGYGPGITLNTLLVKKLK